MPTAQKNDLHIRRFLRFPVCKGTQDLIGLAWFNPLTRFPGKTVVPLPDWPCASDLGQNKCGHPAARADAPFPMPIKEGCAMLC